MKLDSVLYLKSVEMKWDTPMYHGTVLPAPQVMNKHQKKHCNKIHMLSKTLNCMLDALSGYFEFQLDSVKMVDMLVPLTNGLKVLVFKMLKKKPRWLAVSDNSVTRFILVKYTHLFHTVMDWSMTAGALQAIGTRKNTFDSVFCIRSKEACLHPGEWNEGQQWFQPPEFVRYRS